MALSHQNQKRSGSGWGGGGGRDNNNRNRDNKNYNKNANRKNKPPPKGIDLNNPVVKQFQIHANKLDAKNEKYERIVKLNRDITIESKRVIFLLHRILTEDDKPQFLLEAEVKMNEIKKNSWFFVACEMREEEDPYRFARAYSGGLQEYIEALSFYHYICFDKLIQWQEVCDDLKFRRRIRSGDRNKSGGGQSNNKQQPQQQKPKSGKIENDGEEDEVQNDEGGKVEEKGGRTEEKMKTEKDESSKAGDVTQKTEPELPKNESAAEAEAKDENIEEATPETVKEDLASSIVETPPETVNNQEPPPRPPPPAQTHETITIPVSQSDFVLGLADLTGEVMRQAINYVGCGNTEACFRLLGFLHKIADGYAKIPPGSGPKETFRKINVLKQSLRKVEDACYTISVRGTEIPKHLLPTYFEFSQTNKQKDFGGEDHESQNHEDFF